MKRLLVCLAGIFAVQVAQAAAPAAGKTDQEPPVIYRWHAAVPESRVPAVGTFDPTLPFGQPVAKLDGTPIYRPLFPSLLTDPVDRALIVRDYQKQGYKLPTSELDAAFKRYQRDQFHGINALRDNRLLREGATLDEYRGYVAEEIKINIMLCTVCGGATSWTERGELQKNYLTQLRRKATIENLSS